ncbi:MAG: hypothetical protein AAF408_03265 [Pseudomonadota bacterium]
MTTKTASKTAAKKPAPRKRKLDLDRLRQLTDELAGYGSSDLTNLIHRWESEEKAKITGNPAGGTLAKCRLAGLTATATSSQAQAVRNWGQAARRILLKEGAT